MQRGKSRVDHADVGSPVSIRTAFHNEKQGDEVDEEDSGTFKGECVHGRRHGSGSYLFTKHGCQLVATWQDGMLSGPGKFTSGISGQVMLTDFSKGGPVGRGMSMSADGSTAWELHDGVCGPEISLPEAQRIARSLGLSFSSSSLTAAKGSDDRPGDHQGSEGKMISMPSGGSSKPAGNSASSSSTPSKGSPMLTRWPHGGPAMAEAALGALRGKAMKPRTVI